MYTKNISTLVQLQGKKIFYIKCTIQFHYISNYRRVKSDNNIPKPNKNKKSFFFQIEVEHM